MIIFLADVPLWNKSLPIFFTVLYSHSPGRRIGACQVGSIIGTRLPRCYCHDEMYLASQLRLFLASLMNQQEKTLMQRRDKTWQESHQLGRSLEIRHSFWQHKTLIFLCFVSFLYQAHNYLRLCDANHIMYYVKVCCRTIGCKFIIQQNIFINNINPLNNNIYLELYCLYCQFCCPTVGYMFYNIIKQNTFINNIKTSDNYLEWYYLYSQYGLTGYTTY